MDEQKKTSNEQTFRTDQFEQALKEQSIIESLMFSKFISEEEDLPETTICSGLNNQTQDCK